MTTSPAEDPRLDGPAGQGQQDPPAAPAAREGDDPEGAEKTVRRREFLTEPGEPLQLAPSPIESGMRLQRFLAETGMSDTDVLLSEFSAVPMPLHSVDGYPEGRKRWAGVRADAMWLPLMWLPNRVANRYRVEADDGQTYTESHDMWVVRVGLELSASGLYDDESGMWVDVLDLFDLDIDDPAVLARVDAWLNGADDEVLDGIDLSELMTDPDDEDWALREVDSMWPRLQVMSWALQSDSLHGHCVDVLESPDMDPSPRDAAAMMAMIAGMAAKSFSTFEDEGAEEAYWSRLEAEADAAAREIAQGAGMSASDVVHRFAPQMRDRLQVIRDAYWPMFQQIEAEAQAATAPRHAISQ